MEAEHKPIREEVSETSSTQSGRDTSGFSFAGKIEQLEKLYYFAILGIILVLIVIGIDIVSDFSLHTRITNLEREIADNKVNFSKEISNLPNEKRVGNIEKVIEEEKEILNCLKFKKYWQYEECFTD